MPVQVSGQGSVSVSVSGGAATPVGIAVTPGVGPTIISTGTATSVMGALGVQPFIAGSGISIETASGGIRISSDAVKVLSVQGRTGSVTLSAVDLSAAPLVHTHSTSEIAGFTTSVVALSPKVLSVQGRTGSVTLSVADLTAAGLVHTHSTSQITGFSAAALAAAPVRSVQGRTGSVTILLSDLTAAPAIHTHSTVQISQFSQSVVAFSPIQSVNGLTGTIAIEGGNNVTITTASNSIVVDADFPAVRQLNGFDGNVSIAGGGIVTVQNSGGTVTISASGSTQAVQVAVWPAIIMGG